MKAPIKILCGLTALAIGLLLPGIDGKDLITSMPLQALNAIPLAMIEIILVCAEPGAFFGAAAWYFFVIAYGYSGMATGRPDAQRGLGLVIMHLFFGPIAVMFGAVLGHFVGAFIRMSRPRNETRGFEIRHSQTNELHSVPSQDE